MHPRLSHLPEVCNPALGPGAGVPAAIHSFSLWPILSPKGSLYAGCVLIADSRVTRNDRSWVRVGSESWLRTRAQGPPAVTRQARALPSGLIRATSGAIFSLLRCGVRVFLGTRGRAQKTQHEGIQQGLAGPDCAVSRLWSLQMA